MPKACSKSGLKRCRIFCSISKYPIKASALICYLFYCRVLKKLIGSYWQGGTGQGLVILEEEIFLIENRISELKETLKYKRTFGII